MGSEWVQISLSDVAKLRNGAGIKQEYFSEKGTPLARVSDFTENSIDLSACRYVDEEYAANWKSHCLKTGDVVIATVGSWPPNWSSVVGKVVRVPALAAGAIQNQNTCTPVPDPTRLDKSYLYYRLKLEDFASHAANSAGGSANQARLPVQKLGNFRFILPPLEEQQKISKVLSTIDDKIALNHQINTTLESMAQALFKSWFVDFDPVIDNALAAGNPIPEPLQARADARAALGDQRKPLPEHIRQQFPDRFVETEEMGWVPEGWYISTIGEQVETTGGGTPSTKNPDFWENGVHPFCTPKDMSQLKSLVLMDTERHLTDAGVRKISSGQLPKGTVLMSSRAPIGYLAISDIPVSVNQGIIAMLPNQNYGPVYLMCWAKTNMNQITDRANGSTFQEISKKNFRPIPFLVPGKRILEAFNEQAEAIYSRILLTSEQTDALTRLRDTLLPKLLSGELRVPEAERPVAEII